jgi:hypothetical protein
VNERKKQKRLQKQLVIAEKHGRAEEVQFNLLLCTFSVCILVHCLILNEKRYEQFVKEKKMKAENETLKVKEVNWINALTYLIFFLHSQEFDVSISISVCLRQFDCHHFSFILLFFLSTLLQY